MTVAELIALLSECPPDAHVLLAGYGGPVGEVHVDSPKKVFLSADHDLD